MNLNFWLVQTAIVSGLTISRITEIYCLLFLMDMFWYLWVITPLMNGKSIKNHLLNKIILILIIVGGAKGWILPFFFFLFHRAPIYQPLFVTAKKTDIVTENNDCFSILFSSETSLLLVNPHITNLVVSWIH